MNDEAIAELNKVIDEYAEYLERGLLTFAEADRQIGRVIDWTFRDVEWSDEAIDARNRAYMAKWRALLKHGAELMRR